MIYVFFSQFWHIEGDERNAFPFECLMGESRDSLDMIRSNRNQRQFLIWVAKDRGPIWSRPIDCVCFGWKDNHPRSARAFSCRLIWRGPSTQQKPQSHPSHRSFFATQFLDLATPGNHPIPRDNGQRIQFEKCNFRVRSPHFLIRSLWTYGILWSWMCIAFDRP